MSVERCDRCNGSGREPTAITSVWLACHKCNGTGMVYVRDYI